MKLKSIIVIIFLPFIGLCHDLHVSVCEIEVSENNFEITLKTFLDDLQAAVGLTPGEEVPEGYSSSTQLIKDYIQSTIQIDVDGKIKTLVVNDISASTEAVWITINLLDAGNIPKNMKLQSTFLTEVYSDQTNIVNIKNRVGKESYILNKKKKVIEYQFAQ